MWNALFGSDEDASMDPATAAKVLYGAGEEPDAMTMLLGRLTTLLERLGEADHARKQWEEKARRLEDTNQKLTYELEYSTDAQMRERIKDLTAMNAALTSVKTTLEKEVETKEARVVEQETVVQELETKVELLGEDHAARLAELEKLVACKEETDREIQRLCRSLDQKVAEIASLSATMEATAREHELAMVTFQTTSESEMADLCAQQLLVHEEDQAKLAAASHDLAELRATVATLEADLASHTHTEAELRQHLAHAQAQCVAVTHELDAEKIKLADAQAKIHRLEMDHAAMKQLQSTWKEDAIRQLTEQVQGTQEELSRMMELNLELSERNVALEEELNGPNPALDHAQEHIQALEDELEAWRSTVARNDEVWTQSLAAERAAAQTNAAHVATLEAALQELEASLELETKTRDELEAQAAHWRQSLEDQQQQTNALAAARRADSDAHAAEVAALQEAVRAEQLAKDKEVLALHATLVQDNEQLRAQLAEAAARDAELADLRGIVAELQASQAAWHVREADLTAALNALRQEATGHVDAAAQLAAMQTHVSALEQAAAEKEAEVATLRQQIANTQAFVEECEETALDWERKHDAVTVELEAAAAQSRTLADAVTALEADKAATLVRMAALEGDVVGRDAQHADALAACTAEHESAVAELNCRLAEYTNTVARLQQQLAATESAATAAQEQADATAKAAADTLTLRDELFAAHEECERLRQAEKAAVAAKTAVETSGEAEKARLLAMLDQGKQAFSVLKAKHTQMLDEFRSVADEKAAWQARLEAAELSAEAESRQLRRELAAAQKMLSDVHASANLSSEQLEEHIRELQHQMHLRENKFESETEELLEEIASLNGQLTEMQVQNNVLSARSHRLARDLSQFMDLPPEDAVLIANPNTPNLWELLATGMEQLKSDLEVASTYASNLDQLDGAENLQDATFSNFSPSNVSQDVTFEALRPVGVQ
ncbi:hypothetical protein ACHHYP_00397 [Achlya hypogyna]|uniref:Uncharacterized protein n=1 Tax=Achlya hypogyna TaxID=1202772 RepID=A0A1V9ZAZ9_ACHHY|nr:hypothetical protein ACHHYP_00397 [Achlya hypogyna]